MFEAILGLDIGTTAAKAVLFDLSGTELATAEQAYPLHTPQAGWVEQQPEVVWQALLQVVRAIVDQAGPQSHILVLALAAQAGSLIPAQADGSPVYPMITWLDNRTEALVNQWQAQGLEEVVRRISGWLLHPGLPLPTIAWLRQFRPDIFAAAERYLSVNDFLIHRLTGRFCTDLSCGAEMQLADITTGQWSNELCTIAGIRPDQLSSLQPAGTVIGPIIPEVSHVTGLPKETVVVNGGHDHCCEALAMGMFSAGQALLTCGTAWVITGITGSPSIEAVPAQMDLNFHVIPGRWTVSQFLGSFGASVEWWLSQSWQNVEPQAPLSRTEMYSALNNGLKQTRPGCNGLFCLPLAETYGGFVGLRLDHTQADMSRAILEGAAFELRGALEELQQAGLPITQVWLAGGATRSPHWPRIIADVTGVSLVLTDYAHWAALGAAILAGVGAGVFETIETAQDCLKKAVHHLRPHKTNRTIYEERFAAYQQLRQRMAHVGGS